MGMTTNEAIEAIKCNWPDSRYTILREALDMAIAALMEQEGKDTYVPTNADRIRAMTDEELAAVIMCPHQIDGKTDCTEPNCFRCSLKWLQQPEEEDDHETNL